MDFHEILYLSYFFENRSRKFRFHQNLTVTTGALHEYQYVRVYMIMSQSLLLKMRIFSGKSSIENQHTFYVQYLFPSPSPSPPTKIVSFRRWRWSRTGHRWQHNTAYAQSVLGVTKATNTHPECVILIVFPQQQLLHEIALVLYMYIACLAKTFIKEVIYTVYLQESYASPEKLKIQ